MRNPRFNKGKNVEVYMVGTDTYVSTLLITTDKFSNRHLEFGEAVAKGEHVPEHVQEKVVHGHGREGGIHLET